MLDLPFPSPLPLSPTVQRRVDAFARRLMQPPGSPTLDFGRPSGEPALYEPDSVAWRIFKNPVSLFIGGVAAVVLELAEPAVRTGVWEHTTFRSDPVGRLRRTGFAAMVSVYGPKSASEPMIERVVRLHGAIAGHTPSGTPYSANDQDLLDWVYATAGFGFAEAYSRYVSALRPDDLDRYYRESQPIARLYGALGAPGSRAELKALSAAMHERLEPSPIVLEFLKIMREAPAAPSPLRPVQRLLVRAAVEIVPAGVRRRLGLGRAFGLRRWERPLVRKVGALSDRLLLNSSPAVQACLRMGLRTDYLYRTAGAGASKSSR
jgi:uncharacterized protein (DUF2236 family)